MNSPRTDIIRHTFPCVIKLMWKFEKKVELVDPWRSSRSLLLSSGFSVTVGVAALSERLLLEGGAWHHLHATFMFTATRPLFLSRRQILKKGSSTSINFDSTSPKRGHFDDDARESHSRKSPTNWSPYQSVIFLFYSTANCRHFVSWKKKQTVSLCWPSWN